MISVLGLRVHASPGPRLGLLITLGLTAAVILSCVPVAWCQAEGTGAANVYGGQGFPETSFGFKTGISFAQHCGTEEREPDYQGGSFWRTGLAAAAFLYLPVTSRFGLQQEFAYV